MTDFKAKIEKLRAHLDRVDAKIAEYEIMAQKAKGPISPSFAARLGDLRAERDRLIEHVRKLQFEDATSWSSDDPKIGVLKVCDEIAGRINDLFDRIEHHRPPQ
ncbi:MAG TPA: hypothetical protein VLS27_18740 [Gammaproteobacteria bacterium]|nr:hypothetical protein [Gammaproteobacteria bacterium]